MFGRELLLEMAKARVERGRVTEPLCLAALVRPDDDQNEFAVGAVESCFKTKGLVAPFIDPDHAIVLSAEKA